MANEEQVERLRRSVIEWNQWRQKHPKVQIDLSGIKLLANQERVEQIVTEWKRGQQGHPEWVIRNLLANQERAVRFMRSVTEWNQWRQEHPEVQIDLSGIDLLTGPDFLGKDLGNADLRHADLSYAKLPFAYLSYADLSYANLSYADLSYAFLDGTNLNSVNLSYANLSGACLPNADLSYFVDLRNANLSYADLSDANLRGALLSDVDLSNANLQGATLSAANLRNTNLQGANLSSAYLRNILFDKTNFTDVRIDGTVFIGGNLNNIKGLETAVHEGPSTVNINSVVLPHDEPTLKHFLRGVGFTETQIEYLPSLLTPRPIEYASLFISYAHQDEMVAKRLYTDLRKKDVPCWFAPHDLRPGTPILRGLEEAIHLQDKFLLILSKHAVNSRWIEREVDAALHQEIKRGIDVLFPIRLDDAVLESDTGWAIRLQHRHIGDFTSWRDEAAYQDAFTRLLQHLKVTQPPINRSASP